MIKQQIENAAGPSSERIVHLTRKLAKLDGNSLSMRKSSLFLLVSAQILLLHTNAVPVGQAEFLPDWTEDNTLSAAQVAS